MSSLCGAKIKSKVLSMYILSPMNIISNQERSEQRRSKLPGSWAHSGQKYHSLWATLVSQGSLPVTSLDLNKLLQSRARKMNPCQIVRHPIALQNPWAAWGAWSLPVFLCSILPWFWECKLMNSSPAFVKNKITTKRSAFCFRFNNRGNTVHGIRVPGSSPRSAHFGFESGMSPFLHFLLWALTFNNQVHEISEPD